MSEQLKRLRHPQGDLFVIDALDAIVKDDLASMEHPFYSLSKKPVKEMDPYEHNGTTIEFRPSSRGFPTIYDKDLVIYAVSHVVAQLEEGQKPPKEVEFDPYDFLVFTQRGTGGRDYLSIADSLDRLMGSFFRTNAKINGKSEYKWRGIIDGADMTVDEKTGRPQKLKIKLSQMVLETIEKRAVLTLNRDYFRLRKPIERRIYQLARKHCGHQDSFPVYLKTLHKKSGSRSSLREFRRAIKNIAEHNHLPDFNTHFDAELDQVTFTPREAYQQAFAPKEPKGLPERGTLPGWVYEQASIILSGTGWEKYGVEDEWHHHWVKTGCPKLDSPEKAFIGFCKKYAQRPIQ